MPSTRVLITGATSGLGFEMARQLARRGFRLALTGRREELLQKAAKEIEGLGGECLPLAGGVSDLAEVKALYRRVRERWGGVDWAVLNAGMSESMDSKEFRAAVCHETLVVNVGGVANWIEAVLPDMLAQRSGVIAGVSSLAAFRGLPGSGPYCASKAALNALLESVRVDLRGTGVDVVTICPGFVKSEITARRDPGGMPFLLETGDGAARMIRGIERRDRLVHFPWQLSWAVRGVLQNLPGFLYDRIAGRLGRMRRFAEKL